MAMSTVSRRSSDTFSSFVRTDKSSGRGRGSSAKLSRTSTIQQDQDHVSHASGMNTSLVLTHELAALLSNRTCIDLTINITTTQLHTAQFHGHAAMLLDRGPQLVDGFLDKPLSLDSDSATATSSDAIATASVHCNHSRLNDLLATCRSLYTDPHLAIPHLTHLLSTSQHSDCTLVVEDPLGSTLLTSARAHKFILAARCPYFSTLFQSAFADTHLSTYSLPLDIFTSPQVFDNVLAFIYTGRLRTSPTSPLHVFDLFQCANYMGMSQLESHLEHVLRTMFHGLDTCTCTSCSAALPAVLLFADRMQLETLRTDAIKLFASSPLTLWTSLDFPTFPATLQSSILSQFTLAAEHDPGTLLAAIVTLDTLMDRLSLRASSKPTAKLLDTLITLRDASLVPQLVPALPHLLNTGTLDRPPVMDIGRRLDVLATHVVPKCLDARNAVMVAFTLATTHGARVHRANAGQEEGGLELDAQVTEAVGEMASVAIEWVAKRWMNVPIAAPRGVYPASAAWQGFVEKVADKVGVSVDEVVAAAAVGVGGSVVGGGGSVVGVKARQPRVRSMVVEGGGRPGVKVAAGRTRASTTTAAAGNAVVGSRMDGGRPQAAVPARPASVVGGMVRASSTTAAARRASTMVTEPQSLPLTRAGPPMNSALRAERARSMIVTSSSSSSSSSASTTRSSGSLRSSSSLAPNRDPARGRPGSTTTSVTARKVTRSPSVVPSVSSSVSTTATASARRAPSSTRPASSSSAAAPATSAIRRTASMATLSSHPPLASTPPSPHKPATSPSSSSRLRRSSTSLSATSTATIPPVPPLPPASSTSVMSERKYDPARLERLRRKSAESAARVALGSSHGGSGSVAAVDLSAFRPSRIPAPSAGAGASAAGGVGRRVRGHNS